jgi:hypothetical protein
VLFPVFVVCHPRVPVGVGPVAAILLSLAVCWSLDASQVATLGSLLIDGEVAANLHKLHIRGRLLGSCALVPNAAYRVGRSGAGALPSAALACEWGEVRVSARVLLPGPFEMCVVVLVHSVAAVVEAGSRGAEVEEQPAGPSSPHLCILLSVSVTTAGPVVDGRVVASTEARALGALRIEKWSELWHGSSPSAPFLTPLLSACKEAMMDTLSVPLALHALVEAWLSLPAVDAVDDEPRALKRGRV